MRSVFFQVGGDLFAVDVNQCVKDHAGNVYALTDALSEVLGASKRTVYREIEQGKLTPLRVGDKVFKNLILIRLASECAYL